MIIVRCTQKLLKRLGFPSNNETHPSTSVLGDWYANLIYTRPQQLVLCMNERSLLVVLLLARDGKSLAARFRQSVLALLYRLNVPASCIETEASAMQDIRIGRTASRRVVGCMVEAAKALEVELSRGEFQTLEEVEDQFSEFLYATIGYRYPRELASELFSLASSSDARNLSIT
jgi:uncharacterized protein DUF6933